MEFFIIMIKTAPYLTIHMYNVYYLVLSFSVPFAFESRSRASVTAMEILKVSDLLFSPPPLTFTSTTQRHGWSVISTRNAPLTKSWVLKLHPLRTVFFPHSFTSSVYISGFHYRRGFQFLPTLSGWSPHPLPGPTLTSPSGAAPTTLVQATIISHLSPTRGSCQGSGLPPASLTLYPPRNNHMRIHMSHRVTPLLKVPPTPTTLKIKTLVPTMS